MIRFKRPKIKMNLNKKNIILSMSVFFIILIGVVPFNLYAGLPEILTGAIAFLIRALAGAIDGFLTLMECGINKLIFNVDGEMNANSTILTDFNLSLLRGDKLSGQLFQLYNLFVYIAGSLLGVIALFVTFDFLKTANDIKHKAMLKQRLTKLVISIVLLLSIPSCFDILLVINQTICDVFRVFIVDTLKAGGDFNGSALTSVFKTLAEQDDNKGDIVIALIYLMSGFINVWLVIYYMIRDLTIAFLFMIAPVIVIFLPYRTDLVLNWLKELCSNIFAQAIQAFILSVEVAICVGIGDTLYSKIFALVAFAMFIPLTGIVKKMLGLDGELGAAKSNAGVGAVTGAMKLAGGVAVGAMALGSKLKSNARDVKNIGAEQELLGKSKFGEDSDSKVRSSSSVSSSKVGGGGRGSGIDPSNRTSTNRDHNLETDGKYEKQGGYSATSRARQLQGMKSNAKKEIFKTLAGGALGAMAGGAMAIGSSVYGDSRASMGAALAGASVGNALGGSGASLMNDGATFASEKMQDIQYGKGVRYDGESLQALDTKHGTKDVTEGTQRLSSPFDFKTMKSNVSTMRENHAKNKDVIKDNKASNKEVIKSNKATSKENQSFATGEGDQKSCENYSVENKALSKRNELERRGNFSAAHRSYAKNTYNRNYDSPPDMDVSETYVPEGSEVSLAPAIDNLNANNYQNVEGFDEWKSNSIVESIKTSIKNPSPIKTPSYAPTIERTMNTKPNIPMIQNTQDMNIKPTIQNPQTINTKPTMSTKPTVQAINTNSGKNAVNKVNNNDTVDLIMAAQMKINSDMQSYDMNQQYEDALKDYIFDVPNFFLDNDDSQL